MRVYGERKTEKKEVLLRLIQKGDSVCLAAVNEEGEEVAWLANIDAEGIKVHQSAERTLLEACYNLSELKFDYTNGSLYFGGTI